MKRIHIDIAPDGAVRIDALGFAGPDCEQATRFLEQALGKAVARERKPEHRRQSRLAAPNRQTQRLDCRRPSS